MAKLIATITAALVAALMLGIAVVTPSAPAGAAGITTHAWMGLDAIDQVADPALAALLDAHRDQVRAGAMFPDGGYYPGNVHGEEAHWSRFTDAYAARLLARTDCGDITRPDGPCAPEVAHLMGVMAHGTGDEVWDWLFEPVSPDLDEYYLPPALSPFQDGSGQELTMDIVAVGLHGRPVGPLAPLPSTSDLLAAFADAGLDGVTEEMLEDGQQGLGGVSDAEASFVADHLAGVREAMPWMTTNLRNAPGGVTYAATAIAGQWDSMWGRLQGEQPPTRVSATYPAAGQRRIPPTGWIRTYQPGSAPGRGGARTRIVASLTYSLPYVPGTGGPAVSTELPPGAMTLTEAGSDAPLPMLGGYPRAVPYGPDAGEHTIDLQPAGDLAPCTWYEVDVTEALIDANGDPVAPSRFSFRTGAAPTVPPASADARLGGTTSRCPDDPYTDREHLVRRMYQDLFARTPSDAEVEGWTSRMARGLTPARLAASLVGASEHRTGMVARAYETDLSRPPDNGGRAFWTAYLGTHSVTALRTRLLSSPEAYAAAGATARGFVAALYPKVLGRTVDEAGVDHWTTRLDGGLSRAQVARRLLVSGEASRRDVTTTYQALLARAPGSAALDYWAPRVAAGDRRTLVRAILASAEYAGRAQPS